MVNDLRTLLHLVVCLIGCAVTSAALALESIAPFPLATLEKQVQISSPAHRILLSPVREVNDEIRSESMARVPVTGFGQLLRIDSDSSRQKAREYYQQALQGLSGRVLFDCQGQECGRSNVWANQIFGQATLYGRDSEQDYLAALVTDGQTRQLVLVYTVTRGNLREYVWVEQLELGPEATLPGAFGGNGRVNGPIIVNWSGGVTVRFDWDSTDRRHLKNWSDKPGTTVVISSHTRLLPDESLGQSMERAEKAATAMSALLEKSGIALNRQMTVVAGPAIQSEDPVRNSDHIELTVISEPSSQQ